MDARIKKLWVDALRSGQYIQGTSRLIKVVEGTKLHCCLGVLCELAAKENKAQVHLDDRGNEDRFSAVTEDGWRESSGDFPPAVIEEWAGIKRSDSEVLSNLNDSGVDFETIAVRIEANL